jgi:hypothetical protein
MADETIERLLVSLEARMKSYETSLNRAIAKTDGTFKRIEDRASRFENKLEATSRRAGAALGRIGGGVGGGLTGRAGILGDALPELGRGGYAAAAGIGAAALGLTVFYQQGRAALQVADDIGDAAETLGVSAEALQEIRFAFNGLVDAEQVDGAIAKLSKTIGEASLGNKEAADTFKTLVVSYKDAAGNILPTEQVLRSVADRIAGMKSEQQQAALAARLFGREAGAKLLPILRQGSAAFDDAATRAKAMGAIIGNDTVARAGELQQELDDLAVVVRAQLTEAFVQAGPQIVAFTKVMAENLPMAVQTAANVLKFLADNLKTVGILAGSLGGARLGAFIGGFFTPLGAGIGALIGAAAGAGAAYLSMGDDAQTAANATVQAIGTMGTAESGHLQTLQSVRDIYAELKTASGERAEALKAEADATIDKATKERLAAAESELARRQAEAARFAANVPAEGSDPMGSGFGSAIMAAGADTAVAEQQAKVEAIKAEIEGLKAAAAGTEKIFEPATASVDDLVQHLGQINGDQITQTQAAMISANQAVQDLVATVQSAPQDIAALNDQYNILVADLASATGWDTAGQSMANFIQGAQDIALQLRDGMITTDQAADRYRHLLDMFGVDVSATQIVGEIGRIKDALETMQAKAQSAFATLGSTLGGAVRRFVLGQGGEVVPDNAGIPRARGTPPPPASTGGGIVLPPSGGGGGGAKAKREQESKLDAFLKGLADETARLSMNSAAQKENELLVRAQAAAKEDFNNKVKDANGHLRESAALTKGETAAIKEFAAAQAAVPDVLSIAGENLPQFNLDQQLKHLQELRATLTDPAIAEALAAQGLSAADASKAIDLEMQKARDSAWGTAEAISAVGDAILTGAQQAGTFADKLAAISLQLLKLLAQGLLGQGSLGGFFNQLFNVGAGGALGLLGGAPAAAASAPLAGLGTGYRRSSASGNRLGAGMGTAMNELGEEAARRGQDIFIPGRPVTVMPATATRSALAERAGGINESKIDVTISGATGSAEIRQAVATGMEIAYRRSMRDAPARVQSHQARFA